MLSIGTWTMPPMVNGDVVMYMLIQLLGTVFFLSLFGNITYLMRKADTNAGHYADKLLMWKVKRCTLVVLCLLLICLFLLTTVHTFFLDRITERPAGCLGNADARRK